MSHTHFSRRTFSCALSRWVSCRMTRSNRKVDFSGVSDYHLFHIFSYISCLGSRAGVMPSKLHFLDPSNPQMTTLWLTFLALIALCPDRFLIFRLRSPFKVLLLAAVSCTFRLQSRFCKNACLHHTLNFHFFLHLLLSSYTFMP